MRHLLILLVCLLSLHAGAQTLSDKLVAYYSFDACTLMDDSGNGSIGTFIADKTCVCGLGDSAVRFDGMDDALLLAGPFKDIFTTSDFTVCFYIKPAKAQTGPGTGGSHVIMSKQADCSNKGAFWVRYAPTNEKISVGIIQNDTLLSTVQASIDDDLCWQYVSIVRNGSVLQLYINGTLRDSKNAGVRLDLTSTAPFKVGEPICTLDKPYKGDLDELRFFSKALSRDDISRYNLHPDQILNGDTLLYLGNSVNVKTEPSCATSVFWSPSTGVSDVNDPNPTIAPAGPSVYYIQFFYQDCQGLDSIVLNVIDPDTLDCSKIFVPNAFTPGGSPGRNDVFGVSNPFAIDEFISFEIFDRWGGRVFNAETQFETWDGSFNGQAVNPGVFLYRLRYKCNGEEKVRAGSLTLLR